ncbi:Mannose-6-phosphate isomerase [Neolecta irregularis DAH-3]|uniref:Mannose-6-phosphate isomerase n=1 Tax=Neolecta irregularis (strain DAH-3) TaxID=1198029 RepID=A0A1U7LVJ5_NEOID|nr:Mannose-6-phosphate isomerase [Neolecta irregularis DAH-3]|eukprot:OLL26664.1 Mannose-6-phosphate isomerase [Neolecta irregularis DAH-3]
MLPPPLIQLSCKLQCYEWGVLLFLSNSSSNCLGKPGSTSAVARFAQATSDSDIDPSKRYAELWMGTHPSGPSTSFHDNCDLKTLLSENRSLLGDKVFSRFDGDLPFLFKVLSIDKALSIQAHPDKDLAKRLHADDPKNYKDSNHKPEMVIAITPFAGLCGFRPIDQIKSFLSSVPEFSELVGENHEFSSSINSDSKEALRSLFTELMESSETKIKELSNQLVSRIRKYGFKEDPELGDLLLRLNEQYPGDIGLFCVFMMNYIKLRPGEAMFLKAKDIHAYLSGDAIECMATSDNVVRAGFTPKFKDVKNLVSMLTYDCGPAESQKIEPWPFSRATGDGKTVLFDPPIAEFSVLLTVLNSGEKQIIEGLSGPSIMICTQGGGKIIVGGKEEKMTTGKVVFVGADAELEIRSETEKCVIYRAFVEV